MTACSKDQKAINTLKGDWKLSAVSIDGVDQNIASEEGIVHEFGKCKISEGSCDGVVKEDGETFLSFTILVHEDGTQYTKVITIPEQNIVFEGMTDTITIPSTTYTEEGTIDELTNDRFITTHTNSDTAIVNKVYVPA